MKTYEAEPGDHLVWICWRGSHTKTLDPRIHEVNHSPTGFSWGYTGSGPAQLAYAILADAVGSRAARPLYQQFKFEVIAKMPQDEGFKISEREVLDWFKSKRSRSEILRAIDLLVREGRAEHVIIDGKPGIRLRREDE